MDFNNDIPIYIQLVEIIKKNIVSGKIVLGEKLPSVRNYALVFKVNPNTVQKALQELEDLGLVITERTNGKYVTKNSKLVDRIRKELANDLVSNYVNNMTFLGYTKEEAIDYLERIDK